MEDARACELLELLAEYGQDYPDTVGATTKVVDVIGDLLESTVPVTNKELAAHHNANQVWIKRG